MSGSVAAYRVIACIEISDGTYTGLGSGVLYGSHPKRAIQQLRTVVFPALQKWKGQSMVELNAIVNQISGKVDGGIAYAVELALLDHLGKSNRCPAPNLIGCVQRMRVCVTEQIWAVPVKELESNLEPIIRRGTRSLKVKLPLRGANRRAYLKEIRDICGANMEIRVDVNRPMMTKREILRLAEELGEFAVTVIEDLVDFRTWAHWDELRDATGDAKIMVDAGITNESSFMMALDESHFDVLNIKLSRVGGILNGLRLAKLCEREKKEVSIGCCEDIGPAMNGILCLACVCPGLMGVEGMGRYRLGCTLLDNELDVRNGELVYDACFGVQSERRFNYPEEVARQSIQARIRVKFATQVLFARARSLIFRVSA